MSTMFALVLTVSMLT
ncbi:hypothetical protein RAF90_25905, partial [Klebsiella pneumoniae]